MKSKLFARGMQNFTKHKTKLQNPSNGALHYCYTKKNLGLLQLLNFKYLQIHTGEYYGFFLNPFLYNVLKKLNIYEIMFKCYLSKFSFFTIYKCVMKNASLQFLNYKEKLRIWNTTNMCMFSNYNFSNFISTFLPWTKYFEKDSVS